MAQKNEQEKAKRLLKAAIKNQSDMFSNGTVVKWVSYSESGRLYYTYAALKTGDKWWITGEYDFYGVGRSFSYETLVKILARDEVRNVQVSATWDALWQ